MKVATMLFYVGLILLASIDYMMLPSSSPLTIICAFICALISVNIFVEWVIQTQRREHDARMRLMNAWDSAEKTLNSSDKALLELHHSIEVTLNDYKRK